MQPSGSVIKRQWVSLQYFRKSFQIMKSSKNPLKTSKMKSEFRRRMRAQAEIRINDESQKQIRKKLSQFKNHQRFKFMKNSLMGFLGKNYTIGYKAHYNFEEQWENKQSGSDSRQSYMLYGNNVTMLISMVVMVVYALTIWARSIQFVFIESQQKRVLIPIYFITIFCQISDAGVKLWLLIKEGSHFSKRNVMMVTYSNFISVIYLCLCIAGLDKKQYLEWWILEIINTYFLYVRASEIYQQLRLKNFALRFEYQFKLFDLILNLIILAHIFAVILYMAGNSGQYEHSWILELNIQNQGQFIKYLYAFYFCTTTILTVGYGDISPQNHLEVGVVVGVQIIGIVMFGYLLNQIGYTVNILRRNRQIIEKDLVTLDKMRHYYKIDDNLMEKGRTYLINQSDRADHLLPDEETSLMQKFNEDLRNKIYMENSLSVIKSSIFFLCRWSKCMQTAVSIRLQHILFAPEEIIYQPAGKQRLYIVRMGKLQVFAEKKGSRKSIYNNLKTIQVDLNKEVSDNTYGLSAIISQQRKINLNAIAKASTSCYFIEKQKFMDCVFERPSDFQYFHEMKLRYELQRYPQVLEVPEMKNSRHHFDPSVRTTIRRYKVARDTILNQRRRYIRSRKSNHCGKHKLFLDNKHVQRLNTLIYNTIQMIPTGSYHSDELVMEENSKASQSLDQRHYLKEIIQMKLNNSNLSEHALGMMTFKRVKAQLHHLFEASKEYTNYFIFSNKSRVLKKLEVEINTIRNDEIPMIQTELRL